LPPHDRTSPTDAALRQDQARESAALAEPSRRFDAILNNTKMAVFMMDERQHCVYMNKAAEELTGYTFAETQGRPLHDVIHHTHPDGRPYPLADCPIDRAFPEENQVEGQETFVHKDGHFYRVAFTASPISDQSGRPIGTVIEARNIEQDLARDAELRESEQRFRIMAESLRTSEAHLAAIFDQTAAGVAETDLTGRFINVNQRYCELVGRDREELLAMRMQDITHPDDLERNIPLFRRAVERGEGFRIEKRYVRPDGSEVWVNNTVNLIRSSDGSPASILAVCIDVTEARRTQEQLREESHNLEILNRTGAAIAGDLDLERVVQSVTDAGVELTGAQFGAFFYNVVDPAGESYMLFSLSGAERSQFERFGMPRNTKVFAPTFAGEGVVRSDDITKDDRYGHNPPHKGMPEGHLPVVSYLAVPVTSRTGEVLGGLFFGHPDAGRFGERHERLMEGIAAQAAIAIDNARLFRAAQHEIEQRVKAEQALTALNETLESRVAEEIAHRSRAEEVLRQAQKMETVGQLSGGSRTTSTTCFRSSRATCPCCSARCRRTT
jgi:PAS domain S-box-containing protein